MTTKPKPGPAKPRTRRKKPLGSHPLDAAITAKLADLAAKQQPLGEPFESILYENLDKLYVTDDAPKPFYTTPPGGEPTIPREPPRMTIERLADDYREVQWFSSPWCEWHEWERYRDEMV